MTLEKVIRYAITGITLECAYPDVDTNIQELVDILIDFGNITGEQLTDLLKK